MNVHNFCVVDAPQNPISGHISSEITYMGLYSPGNQSLTIIPQKGNQDNIKHRIYDVSERRICAS